MAYPSTFGDIWAEVIAKVRLDATDDLQKAKDWVNQAYGEIAVETESVQAFANADLTADVAVYTMADELVRIKQAYVTASGQQRSSPLIPASLEQIFEWSASSQETATSTHYALMGDKKILLWPTPSAADVMTLYYVTLPTALFYATDLPVIDEPYATECLVNGACFKAAVYLKDPDAMLFKQLYDSAMQKLRGHLRRKEGAMTRQFRLTRGDTVVSSDRSADVG